jgi:hypothetical protein
LVEFGGYTASFKALLDFLSEGVDMTVQSVNNNVNGSRHVDFNSKVIGDFDKL